MPRLDFYSDFKPFLQLNLQDTEVVLGRGPECTVQLPDSRVSRRHATIRHRTDGFWIEDHSTHGTRLNATMLSRPTKLAPGDRVYLGPYIILFQPDGAPVTDLSLEVTAQ